MSMMANAKLSPHGTHRREIESGMEVRDRGRSVESYFWKSLCRLGNGGGRSKPALRLEHRHIAPTRDGNPYRFVRTFLLKVQFEPLPKPAWPIVCSLISASRPFSAKSQT